MRAALMAVFGLAIVLVGPGPGIAQSSSDRDRDPRRPPDEEAAIAREVKRVSDLEEDIFDEFRQAYQERSVKQEREVLEEISKGYRLTSEEEARILTELRRAYQATSAEQVLQAFQAMRKVFQGPQGNVLPLVQPRRVQEMFRRLDLNGDGLLKLDEMPEAQRVERDKWDMNGNGFIELEEYGAYFQGRVQQSWAERSGGRDPLWPDRATAKPMVYRADNLPRELPRWFQQLDADYDIQIGLYEWRRSGQPLAEFLAMDGNDDGFLTVREMVRFLAQSKRHSGTAMELPSIRNGNRTSAASPGRSSEPDRRDRRR